VALLQKASVNANKLTVLFITALLILSSVTWLRSTQWSNRYDHALYETLHHPKSAAAQITFSSAAGAAGKNKEATEAIKKAMLLNANETGYAFYYQHVLSITGQPIRRATQKETLHKIKINPLSATTKLALSELANCLNKDICKALRKNYIEWIDAVIEKAPNAAYYYLFKGKAKASLKQTHEALSAFQLAINKDPNYIQPLYEIINILLKNGQVDTALIVIEQFKSNTTKTEHDSELNQLVEKLTKTKK